MNLSQDAKLIKLLKRSKSGFLSGEEISRTLEISRQALWKRIDGLREAGFEIEGIPHQGYRYRKSPKALLADEIMAMLRTKIIGQRVMTYQSIDSTNRLCVELAQEESPEGTVIFSEEQTKGRGRLSRHWASPKGKGLYLSILLRPNMELEHVPKITLMAATSVIGGLKQSKSSKIGIRWPNDIVMGHGKIGGILTEMSAESDRVRYVVVGIGLNVHKPAKPLPDGGISLEEATGLVWDRLDLVSSILEGFEERYESLKKGHDKKLSKEWEKYSILSGKRVKATTLQNTLRGTALGIDSSGALWIREDSGLQKRLVSADLQLIR